MPRDPNVVTTSTRQKLGEGPADMANQGGKTPPLMSPSTRVPLGRSECRVANLDNRPRQGQVVTTSTEVSLSRAANPLYEPTSKIAPLVNGKGGGKRRG